MELVEDEDGPALDVANFGGGFLLELAGERFPKRKEMNGLLEGIVCWLIRVMKKNKWEERREVGNIKG